MKDDTAAVDGHDTGGGEIWTAEGGVMGGKAVVPAKDFKHWIAPEKR